MEAAQRTADAGGEDVDARIALIQTLIPLGLQAVEVPLQAYQRLQVPRAADEGMLRRILYGLSCRDCGPAAETVPLVGDGVAGTRTAAAPATWPSGLAAVTSGATADTQAGC